MNIFFLKSKNTFLLSIGMLCMSVNVFAQASQAITGIVTDFGGYFKSDTGAINLAKPNNSHNLLAFTYNNIRYSTGVNNAVLTSHSLPFQNTIFKSLPIGALASAPTGNTKAGLGALYDGVVNGPSNPAPTNNVALYLTDGPNGMNLGTGIANLPAGTIDFNIDIVNAASIGDGIPDIVITQIADPSSGTDQYSFLNASGQVVGTTRSISFNGIAKLFDWTADFYEASTNPMTLAVGFTQTDRPVRVWAADFSYFGITPANQNAITGFRIQLNGSSDIAFIAYNYTSTVILPVTLTDFNVAVQQNNVQLNWNTHNEINASHFEIERSTDGIRFTGIATKPASGNSTTLRNYTSGDLNLPAGTYFYRLKQVDISGAYTYSNIRKAVITNKFNAYTLFPNPVISEVYFMHPPAAAKDNIALFSADGKKLQVVNSALHSTQTEINTNNLAAGNYVLIYYGNNGLQKSCKFSKL